MSEWEDQRPAIERMNDPKTPADKLRVTRQVFAAFVGEYGADSAFARELNFVAEAADDLEHLGRENEDTKAAMQAFMKEAARQIASLTEALLRRAGFFSWGHDAWIHESDEGYVMDTETALRQALDTTKERT